MEGKTDNELIAEFMGRRYGKNADHNGYLKYATSWDHLMPVVEKMSEFGVCTLRPGFAYFENYAGEMRESHKFRFSKSTMDFETEDDSPVAWVFIVACVCLDGIKWYNRQKEK